MRPSRGTLDFCDSGLSGTLRWLQESRWPLVTRLLTLVANSIPYSRGHLQRRESRAAGPRQRRPRPPLAQPHYVDRRRRQEVLKVGLGLANIATTSQPAPSVRLFMRPLDACPGCVPPAEFLRLLLAAGRLERLVLLARQQSDDPRLLLRPRALRPRRARGAILPREPRLDDHPVLRVRVRQPGDALLTRRASHHLTVPVHREASLVEAGAGAGLPAGILGHRADDRHAVGAQAGDQDQAIGVALVDQVLA